MWLGFCNPHGPVDAPRDYTNLYHPDDIQLSEKYLNRPDSNRGPEEKILRRWIAHYYGLCTMIDDLMKTVCDTLKATGQWENTLIIYTSDHGEMMGDLGSFGKGNFFEPVIRVPLIIKEPGLPKAQSTKGLTELIDLAPTILDYAGLPAREVVQGRSLRPLLNGESEGKSQILCEYLTNDRQRHGKCLRTDRYKYVLWAPTPSEELYDLKNDPLEWHNLAVQHEYADVLSRMRQRLALHLIDSEKPVLKS